MVTRELLKLHQTSLSRIRVTKPLFLQLCLEECPYGPEMGGVDPLAHFSEMRFRTGQPPGLHEVGDDGQIRRGFPRAIVEAADRMPWFQADVPQKGNEIGDGAIQCGRGFVEEDEQVDVRGRMQFPPAVAAYGDQGRAVG